MKSTGIVRKIDELGRVVLPIELRRVLSLDKDSSLEIYVDDDTVILKKYQPACIFCGVVDDILKYESRNICKNCRSEIANLE